MLSDMQSHAGLTTSVCVVCVCDHVCVRVQVCVCVLSGETSAGRRAGED